MHPRDTELPDHGVDRHGHTLHRTPSADPLGMRSPPMREKWAPNQPLSTAGSLPLTPRLRKMRSRKKNDNRHLHPGIPGRWLRGAVRRSCKSVIRGRGRRREGTRLCSPGFALNALAARRQRRRAQVNGRGGSQVWSSQPDSSVRSPSTPSAPAARSVPRQTSPSRPRAPEPRPRGAGYIARAVPDVPPHPVRAECVCLVLGEQPANRGVDDESDPPQHEQHQLGRLRADDCAAHTAAGQIRNASAAPRIGVTSARPCSA